ncbi:adenylosuccinate lyase [Planctomycetales bacterium]|nr:adenylosuccinate lyase [Planctomycetales bacterium]GHS96422.1 adenylosuccinate lyase [Planctomycetales bacterium]GHT02991.1 adenylosuccinate lyase [Planctomycetales bacterium]
MTAAAEEDLYQNPLITRYASREMAALFSMRRRTETWRELWVYLAEAEREQGLKITPAQIAALKKNIANIDWNVIAEREKKVRHDVMAHVYAFGLVAPVAAPIIHLGATSCYVTDNGDLIIMREALRLLAAKTAAVLAALADFAQKYRALPTLGFTHFQPAQPTTVGKRATLWAQDLALDLAEIERRIAELPLRGATGTTGTQASFMELFNGDEKKIAALNKSLLKKCGFAKLLSVTGQTYTRKLDSQILATLAGLGESAHKFATDLRLLAGKKEIEEPFEKSQIGSSAMAYKRNPMRSERICSLARFLMSLPANAYATHATQWLERTLDDSANRRLTLPEAFLAADAILELCANVANGLVVYPKIIERNLTAELPFMMTENILMAAVKAGGDRQELHEKIREHSQAAAAEVKQHGRDNDLLSRLQNDAAFAAIAHDFRRLADPSLYVGRAPAQVDDFVKQCVAPLKRRYGKRQLGQQIKV